MKKFILSIVFIIASVFVVDRIGGMIMRKVVMVTKSNNKTEKLRRMCDGITEDLLFLGTSRCEFHYVPSIFTDTLNISAYNGGLNASDNIYAQYAAFSLVLEHSTPKIVCLDVVTNYFIAGDNFGAAVSEFGPYIGQSKRIDDIYLDSHNWLRYNISHLYRYNKFAILYIAGLFVDGSMGKYRDKGYEALPEMEYKIGELKNSSFVYSYSESKMDYLHKFLDLCTEYDIMPVFVVSPRYTIANKDEYSVYKQIAAENNIPFFDYHTSRLFHDRPDLFRDHNHLWDKGAREFSAIFAHDLKQYLDSIGYYNVSLTN